MNSPGSTPFIDLNRRQWWPNSEEARRPPGAWPMGYATRRAADGRQRGHHWVQARPHEAQFALHITAGRLNPPEFLVLPLSAALAWQLASASASLSTWPTRNERSNSRRRRRRSKPGWRGRCGARLRIATVPGTSVPGEPMFADCTGEATGPSAAARAQHANARADQSGAAAPRRSFKRPSGRSAHHAERSAFCRPRRAVGPDLRSGQCPCPPSRSVPRAGTRAQKKAPGCPGTKPWR